MDHKRPLPESVAGCLDLEFRGWDEGLRGSGCDCVVRDLGNG